MIGVKQVHRVLVTGGLGFIGSHIIEKIISSGNDVLCIDNLSNNSIVNTPKKGLEIITKNILDVNADEIKHVDLILHLASPIGTVNILNNAGYISKHIIDDLYWTINMAKINKCPIIFMSTCEVYGEPEFNIPLSENDKKIISSNYAVRNEYSISKLLCEIILYSTSLADTDFKYQIVRPFNVVGPGQKGSGGHVIPRFFNQASSGSNITVYGDGSQKRSFIHIDDFSNALYEIINIKNMWNNTWNIGNINNTISILDLAKNIIFVTGSSSKITFAEPKELHGNMFEDSPTKLPNSSKLELHTSWRPKINIYEIIKEIYER